MIKGVMIWANKIVARFNWSAFDHASHVSQLRSCNYYVSAPILITPLDESTM